MRARVVSPVRVLTCVSRLPRAALPSRCLGAPASTCADAAIPRCTFVDKHSGLTADITAGPSLLHRPGSAPLQHSGELASAFVRRLQLDYPPLRPLVLILKALLRRAHYHEPFMGGLSSHGLVMMVGTLLRVREREQGAYAVRGVPLSVLLCEFLFVFGFEFDYGRLGISLRRGDFFDRVEIGDYAAPLLIEVCAGPVTPCSARRLLELLTAHAVRVRDGWQHAKAQS